MDNRALVHPDRVRALFNEMKQQLEAMDARRRAEADRLRGELASLQAELAEVCAQHDALRAAVIRRTKAEAELRELHRMRDLARARAAVRDPAAPLH